MKLTSLYRVDTVPLLLKPFYCLYSYAIGVPLAVFAVLVRLTSRVEFVREPGADERAQVIIASWHQFVWCQFIVLAPLGRFAALSHPLWYMEPVYVMLRLLGMRKLILGSAGNGGRQAAASLVECLKDGKYSAVINPDGPGGPILKAKKGVLFIAAQTGLPIIPVRYECRFKTKSPGWDHKWLPLPFGSIRVVFGSPMRVAEHDLLNLDALLADLESRL